MDHREDQVENAYAKELAQKEGTQHEDYVTIDGKKYRVPYTIIREVTFENVKKEEMQDPEHAARLQYRLMLLEPVVKAKVEYNKQRITIVYNPDSAKNRMEKISISGLISFFEKEGVHLKDNPRSERDFDYVNEMYEYQFNPKSIREHPPYGYTSEEWKSMKQEYIDKMNAAREKNTAKFKEWQENYAEGHTDVLADKLSKEPKKLTLKEKMFGKKSKKRENEKQFWFHGAS